MSPRSPDVDSSVAVNSSPMSVVDTWPCGLLENVPLLHTSRLRPPASLACGEFYQAFPRVSTASDNAGVRRPGIEAKAATLHRW